MKAADLDPERFLAAVDQAGEAHGHGAACWWDVAAVLRAGPYPDVPDKVVLAKARRLERQGRLDGCTCGCRGDWRRRDEGNR